MKTLRKLEFGTTTKWIALSVLIGIVAGLGAIAFQWLVQAVHHYSLHMLANFSPSEPAGEHAYFHTAAGNMLPWAVVGIMTAGGLLSGLLVYSLAPEAEGHGTDAAIDAFHNKRGFIPARVPLVKLLASAITIGTGGSAGREGPIAQIGAGFGAFLADRLKLSVRDRRIMLAAGMGAGVGAIFRAPLAGALFAGEILYRDADLEANVIVPAAVSSTIAYCVYTLSLPFHLWFTPLFGQEVNFELTSLWVMIPYTALALVLVAAGVVYIKVFYGMHELFKKLPGPPHFRPMVGAFLAGVLGLGLYYALGNDIHALAVWGSGYGILQQAFTSESALGIQLLLAVAGVKILTTGLTIGSGGSGGVFGPSMVIGGCLGAAVGSGFHQAWPSLAAQPQAFAIVGMAGFFAGCARAPFSTILMVSELTGDYKLLLPTLWVSTLCFLMGHRWTLYHKQVPTRLESPAHRGDFLIDVLEGIRVEDVFQKGRRLIKFHEGDSLDRIVHSLTKSSQRYFPVVDDEDNMLGIFSAEDVRSFLYDDAIWQLANARDVMVGNVLTVTPQDDLNTALTRFTTLNIDELPVVDATDSGKLLGIIRRKETIAAYNRRLVELKHGAEG